MESLWRDVRYGIRRLRREPGFTAVATLTLALGIGLNSALFSLIDGLLLRPVPYPDSDRVVFLTEWSEQVQNMSFSVANFKDVRDQSHSFEALGAVRSTNYTLTGAGEAERLKGRQATAGFLPALGIRPMAGRGIGPDDDRPGATRVAVLAEGFWARRFGRDPAVVGRPLTLNGEAYTVVGVVPAAFHRSWQRVDVFTSLLRLEDEIGGDERRGSHPGIYVVGRLSPGISVEMARTEVVAIAERLATEYPDSSARQSMTLRSISEVIVGPLRPALLVLAAAVGLVLLIACANVANLLLARGAARGRELAVRLALGASRHRLIRQLLTESVLLASLGGAFGILVAFGSLRGMRALIPEDTAGLENVGIHATVLVFTLVVSAGTGILFGLVPAWKISRPDPNEALREGGRTVVGGSHQRLRQGLVVAEVSLSLVLLVCAGLLVRSFVRIVNADAGFDPKDVLTARLSLPAAGYGEDERVRLFTSQVVARAAALPGVRVAASALPLLAGWQNSFRVEGRPEPEPGQRPSTDITRVSGDYFEAMGVGLVRGRLFDERDHADATPVCIVDATFARTFWPDEDPLGKRFTFGGPGDDDPWLEIVGVVEHVKNYGVDEESRVETYVPQVQSPLRSFTLIVRTDDDPANVAEGLRRVVREVDPNVPVFDVQSLDQIISDSRSNRRVTALLTGAFAVLALVLAGVGIYGVMSYSVEQRVAEIGIRVALGAERGDIVRMVLGRGMALTAGGIMLGLVAALGLARLIASMLFQVAPTDPPTFSITPVLLAFTALVACYLPARRATRVDPSVALRHE